MLWLKGLAIHFVGQQCFFSSCFSDLQASLVRLHHASLYSSIKSGENNFDGIGTKAGFFKNSTQRCAGPLGGSYSFKVPWLTDGTGSEKGTAISRTLHCYRNSLCWKWPCPFHS